MDENLPASGSIPFSLGMPSVLRIPIPGTNGLCIEFQPRGWKPKSGSTSTLFFQDMSGKKHLRLDYGINEITKTVDYHWNQKGTYEKFGISGHTPVGTVGAVAYNTAKYFAYAGRKLAILGMSMDAVSIVLASKPIKRTTEVVSAWSLAWGFCRLAGSGGAAIGTLASPIGTAVGGVSGCIIGGYAGYRVGSAAGGAVYDWANAYFTPLPEVPAE